MPQIWLLNLWIKNSDTDKTKDIMKTDGEAPLVMTMKQDKMV